jgi:hypothetical protein
MNDWSGILEIRQRDQARFDNPHQHLAPKPGDPNGSDWERVLAAHDENYSRPLGVKDEQHKS